MPLQSHLGPSFQLNYRGETSVIALENFDQLLAWLDPDPEVAAQRYESIRRGLIRIYVSRGFSNAEWMADETFDRVMKRVPEIASTYEGDPAKYFYGVARNIMHEELRKKEIATDEVPEPPVQLYSHDDLYDCLMECMDVLSFEKQELILDYHLYHGKAKIDHHRQMAAELSITEGALRTRAHHLRVGLEKCILQCLSGQTSTQKPQLTT